MTIVNAHATYPQARRRYDQNKDKSWMIFLHSTVPSLNACMNKNLPQSRTILRVHTDETIAKDPSHTGCFDLHFQLYVQVQSADERK